MIGKMMKRLDEGKVSLVEFLRSIRFSQQKEESQARYEGGRFAHFYPRARSSAALSAEDSHLIRSAN
jgi:hypothetical protein